MNWLKILVGFCAILVSGCAAYFSVTGLGVLFAGATKSVMVMASSLELAKLVAATYLKQKWDTVNGFNKWYLAISVGVLMLITSAGIFGYLSNAFQQQNLILQKVERDILVYQSQIDRNDLEIQRYTIQLTNQQNIRNSQEQNLTKQIDREQSTYAVSRLIRNADSEITSISNKIDELTQQNNIALDSINSIKNTNIELEREIGGFRFVADSFDIPLNDVVKFFILIIVLVFDPLAVALIIAFNGMVKKKDNTTRNEQNNLETPIQSPDKTYQIYGDGVNITEPPADAVNDLSSDVSLDDTPIPDNNPDSVESSQPELIAESISEEDIDNKDDNLSNPDVDDVENSNLLNIDDTTPIMDSDLENLKPDYTPRSIDLDGDGSMDGIDTDGDGMIDKVIATHPNRALQIQNILPYYAREGFDWTDKKWINDQNAVNYWIKNIKPVRYPTNFDSKTY
jgi:hypothetical protein